MLTKIRLCIFLLFFFVVSSFALEPGDEVNVQGILPSLTNIISNGTADKPIIIQSYGAGAIITGEGTEDYALSLGVNYINVYGIKFTDAVVANGYINGDNIFIKYCEFYNGNADGVQITGDSAKVISSLIYNNADDGVVISGASDEIVGTVIYGSGGDGLDIDESCTVKNSIVRSSTGNDINIASAKTVTGQTNIFEDAGKAGSGTYANSGGTMWSTNPLFLNASANNFRLTPASPGWNKGTTLADDYDGALCSKDYIFPYRVIKHSWYTPWDIGVYEFVRRVHIE